MVGERTETPDSHAKTSKGKPMRGERYSIIALVNATQVLAVGFLPGTTKAHHFLEFVEDAVVCCCLVHAGATAHARNNRCADRATMHEMLVQ